LAFRVYEAALYVTSIVLAGGADAFAPAIVWRIIDVHVLTLAVCSSGTGWLLPPGCAQKLAPRAKASDSVEGLHRERASRSVRLRLSIPSGRPLPYAGATFSR
jgi:hypothetical protein